MTDEELLHSLCTQKRDLQKRLKIIERSIEICGHWLKIGVLPELPTRIIGIPRNTPLNFLSYKEAREFTRRLYLKNIIDWREYVAGNFPNLPKKPRNIPATPHIIYKDKGWVDWYDFIGKVKSKDLLKNPKEENSPSKIDVVLATEAEMEENQKKSEKKLKANSPHF